MTRLHNWQILTENKNRELEVENIDSEYEELTEDLFNTIQHLTDGESKILSIARIS